MGRNPGTVRRELLERTVSFDLRKSAHAYEAALEARIAQSWRLHRDARGWLHFVSGDLDAIKTPVLQACFNP
jgi:hypothetical protein